ncbi:D-aminoacyl-tRNA deacylase [Amphibacillus sediminis]|uniref:D-aminoacyl-tRNA deacylase n=1 Tax=Amphibacillus sediminis TaxID=360185 RepID=UPI000837035E|nr:D-aminoacyl-tRNA deacylase [Amphibacillus sediminis]
MKAVIQRVSQARVKVDEKIVGEIGQGLVVLLGVTHEDTDEDLQYLVKKISHLRIFEDKQQKMNLSVQDIHAEILSISQFTLYSDTRKGRRPNFIAAAKPDKALPMYETFNQELEQAGIKVETGEFGAMMAVELINDGPVTIVIDSQERH